jgi:hypothetical protein
MILELHRQGISISSIARRVELDRKTVRRYILQGLEPPTYGPRQPRVTQLRAFEPYLRERLAAFPQLTGRRLHRELRDLGWLSDLVAAGRNKDDFLIERAIGYCRFPCLCALRKPPRFG